VNAAYVIIALPLAGAIVLLFGGRRTGDPGSGWLATVASAGAFVATVVVWATLLGRSSADRTVEKNIFTWIPVGGLHVDLALQLDPLSITMALFVTGVGSLIHLYSIGYMKDDPSFGRFFFLMNLFLFSMLVLVLANNYLFSFIGWEGVGFCSYGLVGFWFERNSAAVAAKKAFVTNRVGDFGFMIALFLLFGHFRSFDYSTVLAPLSAGHATLANGTATAIGLMLFLGAVGKSAQLPLYMWLPDAMEGPTPVSALIHAATMVTAGVYLVARSAPILHFSPSVLWVIAIVGATSALFAATIACAQDDIKRVLAYSTISQLGYMFLGEGSGDYTAGLYHMIMHAFFKALLFLAAGSVIHGLHDEQNMKKMGGLSKYMRLTFPTFIIGYLALAAIPPFDGFWSKDEILQAAWHMSPGLWVVGVVTAGLTAYYMSRQVALVWFGNPRWAEPDHAETALVSGHGSGGSGLGAGGSGGSGLGAGGSGGSGLGADGPPGLEPGAETGHPGHGDSRDAPHEAPWTMAVPLVILAFCSTFGWLINAPFGGLDFLQKWLAPVFPATIAPAISVSTGTKWTLGIIATGVAFLGLYIGLRVWVPRYNIPALEPPVLVHGWYVDEGVAAVVSGPLEDSAEFCAELDDRGVDGLVNGVARLAAATGRQLRRVETGYVRNYALGIGIGAVIVLAYVATRVGS
jgi:NADH-quinone oxidoreductase subunit L